MLNVMMMSRISQRCLPVSSGCFVSSTHGWLVSGNSIRFVCPSCHRMDRDRGFTLVEMIIVILIAGILSGIVAVFIVRPIQGYSDLARRTALVDTAESALRRFERDVRIALPNSVRRTGFGGGGFALELLPTLDGGKYEPGGNNDCNNVANRQRIRFAGDANFDVIAGFRYITPGVYSTYRMVVNNLGTVNNDVYADGSSGASPGVITPLGINISITRPASANTPCPGDAANDHVTFSSAHSFRGGANTNRRIYVVTTPITYLCLPDATNPSLGTLVRYENYPIVAAQPSSATIAPLATASSALIANRISACSATTTAVDVRNTSLVTVDLSITEADEQIRLIHQMPLDNSR